MSTKLWSLDVRELMDLQWTTTGVEYPQHLCRWEYRNGCLVPSKGTRVRNRKLTYGIDRRRVMPVTT